MFLTYSRLQFALRWALGHLLVSALVAALAAMLVFWLWYPDPWRQMLGVAGIFGLVVIVDVVCGPLLTLVLSSPKKSQRERWLDLSLIAAIQLAALGYGLWSVYVARPVVLAFEVDRLVVVTANEVQTEQLQDAPPGMQHLPWAGGLLKVGLRSARSSEEYLESIEQSIGGVTQAMRPSWWIPYEDTLAALQARARPTALLRHKGAEQARLLDGFLASSTLSEDHLKYLPLTSSKNLEWVALLNEAGDIVGHLPIDGFD